MKPMIKKISLSLMTILLVLGVFLFFRYPDKNLFILSSLERDQMLKRDGYLRIGMVGQIYGRKIGKYYFNRYMIYSLKLVQKVSISLDPIKYFSSGEQSVIPYFLFPFFILGFLYLIGHYLADLYKYLFVSAIFTCLIVADKTVYLYLPLIIISIAVGFLMSYKYLSKIKK